MMEKEASKCPESQEIYNTPDPHHGHMYMTQTWVIGDMNIAYSFYITYHKLITTGRKWQQYMA